MPHYGNLDFNLPGAGGGGGFMNISYMKNQTTPSVVYTQRPMSSETMHVGESSASSSSYYPYPDYANNSNQNKNPPPYLNYNNFNGHPNYGAGGGVFGGSSPPAPYSTGFSSPPVVASTSKVPPPPPSPPKNSTWDFLNPFETFEKYYPAYNPSHDSREVREEEGIPDLEDEDDEVVKEVHVDQKLVDSGKNSYSKTVASEQDARVANVADLQHTVYQNAVDAEERSKDRGNTNEFKPRGGFKDDLEVVKEIQVQFERASESGNDLAKFLEVGKLPYNRKHSNHHGKDLIFTCDRY